MYSIYDSRSRVTFIFILAAIIIAIASLVVSNAIIKDLAHEERGKMEIWSEATKVMTSDDPGLNMNLILRIIQGNTTIPAILCSDTDSVIYYNNISLPDDNEEQFLQDMVNRLKRRKDPIIIDLEDGTCQYLYYDDSTNLKRLLLYPYAQLSVVTVFIIIAFLALISIKRAEQNKVWVGLSKETAHQLGTPISSLIAWLEYLRSIEIDDSLLNEMDKDMKRLRTIAERFSKIGSIQDPVQNDLIASTNEALDYMRKRVSSKVRIITDIPDKPLWVLMNDSLYGWVIENIIKNAVDAMDGEGEIMVYIVDKGRYAEIDFVDSGRGIPKSRFKSIFNPGYTTKERGWGLGLSLAKRIIESFQGGKIFVKCSELGKGTTFRIKLRKYIP